MCVIELTLVILLKDLGKELLHELCKNRKQVRSGKLKKFGRKNSACIKSHKKCGSSRVL